MERVRIDNSGLWYVVVLCLFAGWLCEPITKCMNESLEFEKLKFTYECPEYKQDMIEKQRLELLEKTNDKN